MGLLSLSNSPLGMTGAVFDLSIPLRFDGPQPNHFGAAQASAKPMQSGSFTGDTRLGGSCNATSVTLNAHCNGTHTECVGHLTQTRVSINDVCPALPLLCALITVEVTAVSYAGTPALAVTPEHLEQALRPLLSQARTLNGVAPTALAVRTLPNNADKLDRQYESVSNCPYFEPEAIQVMIENGIDHVLVDVPSIDPYADEGRLEAHRVMFGLPDFRQCPAPDLADAERDHATVTELIYAPPEISDGLYLLNLQIPAFELDAAPSRPLLYELETT